MINFYRNLFSRLYSYYVKINEMLKTPREVILIFAFRSAFSRMEHWMKTFVDKNTMVIEFSFHAANQV